MMMTTKATMMMTTMMMTPRAADVCAHVCTLRIMALHEGWSRGRLEDMKMTSAERLRKTVSDPAHRGANGAAMPTDEDD